MCVPGYLAQEREFEQQSLEEIKRIDRSYLGSHFDMWTRSQSGSLRSPEFSLVMLYCFTVGMCVVSPDDR